MSEIISCHIVDFEKLPNNPLVVDAGACLGGFTYGLMEKLNNRGKYYCIECDKRNYSDLTISANSRSNIILNYNALVGDETQEKVACYAHEPFSLRREWSNIFNLYSKHQGVRSTTILDENVPAITIKKLISKYNLVHIDYLKMDVEGAEFDVIMNMPIDLLTSIPQISFEYHKLKFPEIGEEEKYRNSEYSELDDNFDILKKYLQDNGFNVSIFPYNEVYCAR